MLIEIGEHLRSGINRCIGVPIYTASRNASEFLRFFVGLKVEIDEEAEVAGK